MRHGVPVAAVPAHIMFRAITDTVYLGRWGELSRQHTLPENVRGRLSRMAAQGAGPGAIVATAFAHLERAVAYVLTPSGRTVAATPGAPAIPVGKAAGLLVEAVPVDADGVSPYERWHLYLPDPDDAPPRMVHELASVLGRCQEARVRARAEERQTADELGALLAVPGVDGAAVAGALRACGLPDEGPYRVLVAETGAQRAGLAEGALAEVVAHTALPDGTADAGAVGRLPDGAAFAVVAGAAEADALHEVWPLVAAAEPAVPLYGGTGAPVAGARELNGALAEARYALASARSTAASGGSALTDAATLTGLDALLTGVPAEVRTAYSRTVLGELRSNAVLLETLETFLACDGSWARTAEALHLHVNSVHYRIGRIEHFTGRDLSRLYDRLDLWAALLCRAESA